MILATARQIEYLQDLADKAEYIRRKHPSVIPQGLDYIRWELGITSDKASRCIKFYLSILANADIVLHPSRVTEDMPV